MNYVYPLSDCPCESCGSFQPAHEMLEYRHELVCQTCYEAHEAASAVLGAAQFRYLSHEWLTSERERMPFMLRNQFGRI